MQSLTEVSSPAVQPPSPIALPPDSRWDPSLLFAGIASWPSLQAREVAIIQEALRKDMCAACDELDFKRPSREPYLRTNSPLGRRLFEELLTQEGFTFVAPGGRIWAVRKPDAERFTAYAVSRRGGLKLLDPKYRRGRFQPGRAKFLVSTLIPGKELEILQMPDPCPYGLRFERADSAMRLLLHIRDKFLKEKAVGLSLEVKLTLTDVLGEPLASLYPPLSQHLFRLLAFLKTISFGQVVLWRDGWKPVCKQKWRAIDSIDQVSEDQISFTIDPRSIDALQAFSRP